MRSDHYLHPEFGCLSPTPRLRRELRTAFFSVLFGIGIGAAAIIALNGNNTDDAPVPRGVNSGAATASAIMEPPDAVPGHNSLQAARVEDQVKSASPTNRRLMPIPKTAKSTPQRHARAMRRLVSTFPFPLPSRAECECVQQTTP
jgi:hypothetical protein